MRYYTKAKEFIANLLGGIRGKFRGGASSFRMGERLRGGFSSFKLGDRLRGGLSSFDGRGLQRRWKEGVSRLGRGFNRQNIAQLKSFQTIKNFDYENFFDQVFSPQSYRIIHRGFLVTIFVVATYTMGKMVSYILLPEGKPVAHSVNPGLDRLFIDSSKSKEWEKIVATDLFNTGNAGSDTVGKPKKEKVKAALNLVCDESSKISSLPFKLLNAVVLQNRKKSVASVEHEGKKKMLYLREGDSVENISVKKISWLKMVFINHQSGECEYIAGNIKRDDKLWQRRRPTVLSPEKGRKLIESKKDENVVKTGNTFQIKKELKDDILNNINTILTQAKAVEIKNPDGSLCFKMVDIVAGSTYSTFDIQNNDIICNINGKKIDDLNSLFALFGKMRDVRHFEMVIKRDGQEIPMEYNFE